MNISSGKNKIVYEKNDILLEPIGGYDSVLVFLHGLGDSATGLLPLFESASTFVPPKMKVVLLTAPVGPVTINNGMNMNSWYDIKALDGNKDSVDEIDVTNSAKRVIEAIEKEAKIVKDYNKIFLGGFSQGAAMTLHIGLNQGFTLGGLIVFSGFMFPFTKTGKDKKNVPILICHGQYDPLIQEKQAKTSYQPLFDNNFNVVYKSYPIDHTISEEELNEAKKFVAANLKV